MIGKSFFKFSIVATLTAPIILTSGGVLADDKAGKNEYQNASILGDNVADVIFFETFYFPEENAIFNSITEANDGYLLYGSVFSVDTLTEFGWIAKIGKSGVLQWERKLGRKAPNSTFLGASVCPDGSVVCVGSANLNTKFELSEGWIVKLNPSGKVEWDRSIRLARKTYVKSVSCTGDSNILVAGAFTNSVKESWYHVMNGFLELFRNKNESASLLEIDCNKRYDWKHNDYVRGCGINSIITDDDNGTILVGDTFVRKIKGKTIAWGVSDKNTIIKKAVRCNDGMIVTVSKDRYGKEDEYYISAISPTGKIKKKNLINIRGSDVLGLSTIGNLFVVQANDEATGVKVLFFDRDVAHVYEKIFKTNKKVFITKSFITSDNNIIMSGYFYEVDVRKGSMMTIFFVVKLKLQLEMLIGGRVK